MPKVKLSSPRHLKELTAEWDQIAAERHRQLASGIDLSFFQVVAPAAFGLLGGGDQSLLLDVGSGTGHFAHLASARAEFVVGIEPSAVSVEIARGVCVGKRNVRFIQSPLEEVTLAGLGRPASSAVALMVLMTVPDLISFAKSLRTVLEQGAHFVAVFPHPCFWPTYWGYADAPWFHYEKETFVEAPFSISNVRTDFVTTHIHRPISQYLSTFASNGFRLDAFDEPMPQSHIDSMYPSPWRFPRFLAVRWIRD